ncbi:MAG: hypothetical protein J6C42_05160 [Clostridia bacterium]|nr:hypothetical protein [Clostridia bacterium]MBP3695220.1 hypothetical protein [Thermoguttaceae bacterium]
MAKYIDVERYCREICQYVGRAKNGCDISKCPIWNAPAEDVLPVRDTQEQAEVPKIYYECNRKRCEVCNPACRQTTDVRFAKNFDKVLLREGNVFVELTKDDAESFREQRTYRNMYRLMEVLDYADIARIIMTSKETEKAIRTVALEDEIRILAGNNFVIDLRPLAQRLADIDTEMTDYNTWLDHVWRRLREGVSPEDVVKDLQYLLDKSIEKITEDM